MSLHACFNSNTIISKCYHTFTLIINKLSDQNNASQEETLFTFSKHMDPRAVMFTC